MQRGVMAAVVAVFARRAVGATTVMLRQGPAAGSPVRGSTRWWRGRPAWVQVRRALLDVATAAPPGALTDAPPGATRS